MIAAIRAGLVTFHRARLLLVTAATAVTFAVGSAAVGLLTAEPAGPGSDGGSLEAYAAAGGATLSFTSAAAFAGSFLLAVFAGAIGVEFSRGTLRTLLMQQPGRLRLVAGKLIALLAFFAVVLAFSMAVSWVASVLLAPVQDVSTDQWISRDGLFATLEDYATVMLCVVGWALLGTALGVLVPSLPVAVGIGIFWAGPVEQVFGEAWEPAARWFPGLLLESLLDPEPGGPGTARALGLLTFYCLAAAVTSALVLQRRDITA
jgi:ABC-2 type transport system permease protein